MRLRGVLLPTLAVILVVSAASLLTISSSSFSRANVPASEDVGHVEISSQPSQLHSARKLNSVDRLPDAPNPALLDRNSVPDGFIPIMITDITEDSDPIVTLCKLDFDAYSANPPATPMFRELAKRDCSGRRGATILRPLSVLAQMPPTKKPTGFVFQQSRCGSTLVANMLASIPSAMTFAEATVPASVVRCAVCSEQRKRELLKIIMNAMGNSVRHKFLFFKFQSLLSREIEIITSTFESVPWIFLFRNPAEIIGSYLEDGARTGRLHCEHLRSTPPAEIMTLLNNQVSTSTSVQYCSAYVHHLLLLAHRQMVKSGSRGIPVHYDALPGVLVEKVLPRHFHVALTPTAENRLLEIASVYSKGRAEIVEWKDDSQAKLRKITDNDRTMIEGMTEEMYGAMVKMASTWAADPQSFRDTFQHSQAAPPASSIHEHHHH